MKQELNKIGRKIISLSGLLLLINGLCLLPLIFNNVFNFGFVQYGTGLWVLSLLCCFMGIGLILFKPASLMNWALLIIIVNLLAMSEIISRVSVIYGGDENTEKFYTKIERMTHPENLIFEGNAFTHIKGISGVRLNFFEALGEHNTFNEHGYIGKLYPFKKDAKTVRIACLGGSTTLSGYPMVMENYLNDSLKSDSLKFEVLNFGIGFWTSNHSIVNMIMNVLDYDIDYMIFHHAWNDNKARNAGQEFRNDYSHILKPFSPPAAHDRILVRHSYLYTYIKYYSNETYPEWGYLGKAIMKKERELKDQHYNNKEELHPYRRNIKTFIQLCQANNIKPILVTQPHSVNPEILHYEANKGIDQGNEVARKIHNEFGSNLLFLDLAQIMTEKMENVFIDVGHMNTEGIEFKAKSIGNILIQELDSCR